MKFVVDRIEGEFAILENLDSKEKEEVSILSLPVVSEGTVLIFEDGFYKIDDAARQERLRIIREKMEKLKRKDT